MEVDVGAARVNFVVMFEPIMIAIVPDAQVREWRMIQLRFVEQE
jgi:hypothetical protein